jgi:DNA-binding transcriptional LysR family regulator
MIERPLDLDSVHAFIRIAELGSFTRAGRVMLTTRPADSR